MIRMTPLFIICSILGTSGAAANDLFDKVLQKKKTIKADSEHNLGSSLSSGGGQNLEEVTPPAGSGEVTNKNIPNEISDSEKTASGPIDVGLGPKKKYFIESFFGWSWVANSVGGDAFKTDLAMKFGYFGGAKISAKLGASSQLSGEYRYFSTEFNGIPGITPSIVNMTSHFGRLQTIVSLFSGLGFVGGYVYRNQSAPSTAPKTVISARVSHSIVTGLQYVRNLNSDFTFDTQVDLAVPVYRYETNTFSGAEKFAYDFEVSAKLFYQMTRYLDLGLGVVYRREFIRYEGSGTRGTLNATDTMNRYSIPLYVRVGF